MDSLNVVAVNQIGRRPPLPPLSSERVLCLKSVSRTCFRFPNRPPPLRASPLAVRAFFWKSGNETAKESEKVPDLHVKAGNEASSVVFSSLKAVVATAVASGAMLCALCWVSSQPVWAVPSLSTQISEEEEKESMMIEETEKFLDEQFHSDQCDVEGLKTLMEIKVKNKKIPEAIEVLNKLTQVEPEEVEWPLMRSHLYAYNGDYQIAKNGFSELLKIDPFRVEAYHGLVTVASQEESAEDLGVIAKKIEEAIKLCKKENKKSDARDFKLLLAQIRVIESRYNEALKAYEELVKEEPRDFRPYLCQGIIYTMLRKNKEAEKNFEKYRRLVPNGHPYASYFDDNMMATKLFAQKMENEGAMAKR